MTRVLVTGSVGYNDRDLIFTHLDAIVRLAGGEIVTIVHADVEGAESIAGQIARDGAESGLVDEPRGLGTYYRDLLLDVDEVLAFYSKGADTEGADFIVGCARHFGIPVVGNYDWPSPR